MRRAEQPGGSGDRLTRARHGAPDTHPDQPSAVVVPAVLPHAVATVDDRGHARIVLDRLDRHGGIDCPDGPVGRDELGAVLAGIAEQIGGPVRVEIREPDGSRYADILQPLAPEPEIDGPTLSSPDQGPVLLGEGFLPGEPVLVAVVAASIPAEADGTVRLAVSPRAPRRVDELILFGIGSGTIVRGTAPPRSSRRRRR